MIRVTLQTATIIDHIATTSTRIIIKVGVHVISPSDHYLVYAIAFEHLMEQLKKIIKR